MPRFIAKIESLNRRAQKLGLPGVFYTKVGTDLIPVGGPDQGTSGPGPMYRAILVTVQGGTVKLSGWKFCACVEHLGGENIILGRTPIPEKYRTAQRHCDHCGTIRNRKHTFIVQHDSGEYKQVGSDCLADFLGGNNPDLIAAYAQMILEFDPGDFEGFDEQGLGGPCYLNLRTVVEIAHYMIRKEGFISRTRARESLDQEIATADKLDCYMVDVRAGRVKPIEFEPQDLEAFEKIKEWALAIPANESSDYLYNVRVIFGLSGIPCRYMGIATAAVNTYLNEIRRANEGSEFSRDFYGTPGDKVELELRLLSTKAIDGMYGTSILTKFADAANHLFVWFNTGSDCTANLIPGDTCRIKGTLKKHESYKGISQNLLTRVRIQADKAVAK